MDIDYFKQLNDRYGHGKGDGRNLCSGRYVEKNIPGGTGVARYGGDEFS
ncbi:MAG: GGDEF domain-containing protein [Waltera sp.]